MTKGYPWSFLLSLVLDIIIFSLKTNDKVVIFIFKYELESSDLNL